MDTNAIEAVLPQLEDELFFAILDVSLDIDQGLIVQSGGPILIDGIRDVVRFPILYPVHSVNSSYRYLELRRKGLWLLEKQSAIGPSQFHKFGLSGWDGKFEITVTDRGRFNNLLMGLKREEDRRKQQEPTDAQSVEASRNPRGVWVVHGRDERLRSDVFTFLRAIGLEPLEFSKARELTAKPAPNIGEILTAAFTHAQAVVVLLTPDDEVRLRTDLLRPSDAPYEREFKGQARPNVLFEGGMAWVSHRDRTVLVQIGDVKPFSDVAGVHILHLNNTVERRQEFATRLRDAGCPVDIDAKTDWHRSGNFTIDIDYSSRPNEEQRSDMEMQGPMNYYYKTGDDVPHCPTCWEKDHKAIHLPASESWSGGVRRDCRVCGQTFWEKPTDTTPTRIGRRRW